VYRDPFLEGNKQRLLAGQPPLQRALPPDWYDQLPPSSPQSLYAAPPSPPQIDLLTPSLPSIETPFQRNNTIDLITPDAPPRKRRIRFLSSEEVAPAPTQMLSSSE
jgi:hypothetical protein